MWKFKNLISDIIKTPPEKIDVIKFVNPIDDGFNGKSLSDMFFYDNENIKISQKMPKPIPKHSLLSNDGDQLSEKFAKIVKKWFDEFKNEQGNLGYEEMKKLSEKNWKGSLFRE